MEGSPAIDAAAVSDVVQDARGLSRSAGAAPDAGAVEVGGSTILDADADGVSDLWELRYGLDPEDPADAASDRDADGTSALAEFQSRTDPGDPESGHRIEGFEVGPYPGVSGSFLVRMHWIRVPGITYQVEESIDLHEWRKAAGGVSVQQTEQGNQIMQFFGPTERLFKFYRVVANP